MLLTSKKIRGQCDSSLWTTEKTLQLITLFESNPDLWNVTSTLYNNRNHKMDLQLQIAKTLGVDVGEVISKFHNLRCQYNAELRKLKVRRNSGSDKLYVPRWKFFNAMNFLSNCGHPCSRNSNSLYTIPVKNKENIEDQKPLTDTTLNVLKFLEPAVRMESEDVHSTLSNLCEDSIHMESTAQFSDDHEENLETSFLPNYDKNLNFESPEENCERPYASNPIATPSESPDMWDMVGKFVAVNGREWARENSKLSNEFKTAIYKLLAEFQARAAE